MYKIQTPNGETFLTEKVTYVRQHKSGVYLITDQARAEGVGYGGNFYLWKDGAQCHEFDGADEIRRLDAVNAATETRRQQADDAAIELYESSMAQKEINTAQDDALIEIYELIGG